MCKHGDSVIFVQHTSENPANNVNVWEARTSANIFQSFKYERWSKLTLLNLISYKPHWKYFRRVIIYHNHTILQISNNCFWRNLFSFIGYTSNIHNWLTINTSYFISRKNRVDRIKIINDWRKCVFLKYWQSPHSTTMRYIDRGNNFMLWWCLVSDTCSVRCTLLLLVVTDHRPVWQT